MDTLRAITLFVDAAAAGSFQRVALARAITPQAVSKAIRQLEQHLGVRLFHRTTRRSSLTTDGLAFLESVRPGLDAIDAAVGRARASTEAIEGPLRITAPRFARKALLAPLAEFSTLHPQVQLDLRIEDDYTDIVAAQIDVGFRGGSAPTGQVISRRLFSVEQRLCASPAYLSRHGRPADVAALARHRCTGFRLATTGRLAPCQLLVDGEMRRIDLPVVFCANDSEVELDAVLAGVGIGLIDGLTGADEVRSGRLVPLLEAHPGPEVGFHLYFAQRRNLPRRVRTFIDFIVQRLQDSPRFRFDPAPSRRRSR
ncbi:MAG: LysR family transcriptional regulator [Piscinibacter sp.]|uniref:LysR family transcriptional regulator n=1 Tax=Piscinibacter TaxID=1114981 RepID=UPI000FDE11CD|nr:MULTISPECIES: LysR family transcriptional regulator [Piscinibacter]MCW5666078.1 LysR family transcriptional regulator [Piscinibacter sp.]